jgi:hypothetical protein
LGDFFANSSDHPVWEPSAWSFKQISYPILSKNRDEIEYLSVIFLNVYMEINVNCVHAYPRIHTMEWLSKSCDNETNRTKTTFDLSRRIVVLHRNLKYRSIKVKIFGEKLLNFLAPIFHSTVFNICTYSFRALLPWLLFTKIFPFPMV